MLGCRSNANDRRFWRSFVHTRRSGSRRFSGTQQRSRTPWPQRAAPGRGYAATRRCRDGVQTRWRRPPQTRLEEKRCQKGMARTNPPATVNTSGTVARRVPGTRGMLNPSVLLLLFGSGSSTGVTPLNVPPTESDRRPQQSFVHGGRSPSPSRVSRTSDITRVNRRSAFHPTKHDRRPRRSFVQRRNSYRSSRKSCGSDVPRASSAGGSSLAFARTLERQERAGSPVHPTYCEHGGGARDSRAALAS